MEWKLDPQSLNTKNLPHREIGALDIHQMSLFTHIFVCWIREQLLKELSSVDFCTSTDIAGKYGEGSKVCVARHQRDKNGERLWWVSEKNKKPAGTSKVIMQIQPDGTSKRMKIEVTDPTRHQLLALYGEEGDNGFFNMVDRDKTSDKNLI